MFLSDKDIRHRSLFGLFLQIILDRTPVVAVIQLEHDDFDVFFLALAQPVDEFVDLGFGFGAVWAVGLAEYRNFFLVLAANGTLDNLLYRHV